MRLVIMIDIVISSIKLRFIYLGYLMALDIVMSNFCVSKSYRGVDSAMRCAQIWKYME